jgi:hypothetical protein
MEKKNYSALFENLQNRSNPEKLQEITTKFFSDNPDVKYNDVLKYITLAMNGVSPEYTNKSREAGEKVKLHLQDILLDVEYQYQGSVMTNTHIKGYSDIDLLVISDKFYTLDERNIIENLEVNKFSLSQEKIQKLQQELLGKKYHSATNDLKNNRLLSEQKLSSVYEICDITHPKAIKITNKSMGRDVDIVIANWYDDAQSVINNRQIEYRGIQIYNKRSNTIENRDFPFLSIQRINKRSSETKGRLKKMIRFLKNLKADSDEKIELSSFDINAICYNIEKNKYLHSNKYQLVPILYEQLNELVSNSAKINSLKSVDGHEYIFSRNNIDKKESLKILLQEVKAIFFNLCQTKYL